METEIKKEYYVAEIGRTTDGDKPIYANISYGDADSIKEASKWSDEEFLIGDMEKFIPNKVYRIRFVKDTTVRVIQ